jgi:hypothetical protein
LSAQYQQFDPWGVLQSIRATLDCSNVIAGQVASEMQAELGCSSYSNEGGFDFKKQRLLNELEIVKAKLSACYQVQKSPDYWTFPPSVKRCEAEAVARLKQQIVEIEALLIE